MTEQTPTEPIVAHTEQTYGVAESVAESVTAPAPAASSFDVIAEIGKIPNRFWLEARRALDMTTDEITEDAAAINTVLCVRKEQADTGVVNWDRWLDAGLRECSDFLGVNIVDDSKSS